MAKTNYVEKKITLNELLGIKDLVFKLYENVRDFSTVLELEKEVISPIEDIIKLFEKKRKSISDKFEALEDKQNTKIVEELNKEFEELVNSEVAIKVVKINKEDAEKLNLNVFQYKIIKEFIKD
jgi:flagellar biosynthesis component FlhA